MRPHLRCAAAAVTAFCLALTGQSSILVAAPWRADVQAGPAASVVEVFNARTKAVRRVVIKQATSPSGTAVPTLNEMRDKLRRAQHQSGGISERDKRLLELLDIASIENRAERHARIRSLPVQLKNEPAEGGTIKSILVRGTLRARMFVPESTLLPPPTRSEYREENFESPVPGETIEQPDGALARPGVTSTGDDLCEDEEGWAECATQEEHEDTVIMLASIGEEADASVDEAYGVSNSLDWYCQNNPSYCSFPLADGSDESLAPPCFNDVVMGIGVAIVGADLTWTKYGVFMAAARVTSRAALGALTVSMAAVAVGVIAVAVAVNCYMALPQLAQPEELITLRPEFEPAVRLRS